MNTPYKQISEYCHNKGISKLEERILLHKFYEDYNDIVENYEKNEKVPPSEEIKKGFESSLLSEITLSGKLQLAQEEIKTALKSEIKKSKKELTIKDFFISVGAGVLASFIFTILLISTLSLGQSQVKSWINDLYVNNQQMEQAVMDEQDTNK